MAATKNSGYEQTCLKELKSVMKDPTIQDANSAEYEAMHDREKHFKVRCSRPNTRSKGVALILDISRWMCLNSLPDSDLMAGGVMPKMVIEVPEEFTEVGRAMAEHLAALQRTVSRLGGGKAVDYADIEQAVAESAGRTGLAR